VVYPLRDVMGVLGCISVVPFVKTLFKAASGHWAFYYCVQHFRKHVNEVFSWIKCIRICVP